MVYQITGAFTSVLSPVTPYHYGAGAVYVIAFSQIGNFDTDDPSYLRAFKSTDSGQNWAQAGGGQKQVRTRLGIEHATRVITREHPAWPAQPYLYALYCDLDAKLHVSRFNVLTETWDLESSGDPATAAALPGDAANFFAWSFDLMADGDTGGVLYNDATGYLHTNSNYYARCSFAPLTLSTLSYGAPVQLEGQAADDIVYRAGDVRRGADGVLHGFLNQIDPAAADPETTYQVVLRGVDAGPATGALQLFAGALTGYPYAAQRQDRAGEAYVYVLIQSASPDVRQSLWVGPSTAAGVNFSQVFDEGGSGYDFAISVAPNADIYRAWPSPADELERQTFDGATLGALVSVYSGAATIGAVGAGAFGGSSACVFSLRAGGGAAAQQCYFVGVQELVIQGLAGIPSAEDFGKTHGLTGGGDPPSCGEVEVVPPSDRCGPAYTPPGDDDQPNACATYGYSF
jgi:hypothetical protein